MRISDWSQTCPLPISDDDIASFPAATAASEAAFPDRFVRNGAGELISVDTRPINFARREDKRIRWGFNLSLPVKSKLQREMEAYRNGTGPRSEEHTSELQSLMRISYAVLCLKKKKHN